MNSPTIRHRPKAFPPPEFPQHKPKRFARTPPAVFLPILGLLGLGMALRNGLTLLDLPPGLADLVLGLASALWLFATLAYLAKLARRPAAFAEDLRVLPGRAGVAAASLGGMVVAASLAPIAPGLAWGLLIAALIAHAVQAVLLVRTLSGLPAPARQINPTDHLSYVGFIVAAPAAVALEMGGLAQALFWATLPVALLIWAISAAQLRHHSPPAPLRPLLAIHLVPAALFATTTAMSGPLWLATGFVVFGAVLLLALLAGLRWITASGFSPIWGAFCYPLAACAAAVLAVSPFFGTFVLIAALGIIPPIAWRILKLWPGNRLAQKTNASEA